ncbi:MAG: ABC transporter ATP-binding protein, partial [Ruminiclostridium sp.]|nr:ABC transporter ATP-binding protein [Ruminiclostridium sp.]
MENCIELKNVTRVYPQFKLDDISFSVPCGTVMGFIGENGAGKSTTIRAILGLLKKGEGTITVLGEDANSLSSETKEKIGVVFDGLTFPESLTAKQLDKVLRGIYRNWDSEAFYGYLTRFGLPTNKKLKTFSRGMVMRISIAAALSHHPQLLLLDEPTSGLDPVVRSEILDLFLEFMQDETHSILMSTHITSDLEHIADYICFIHQGKIVFTEDRNEMLAKYRILKCTDEQLAALDRA